MSSFEEKISFLKKALTHFFQSEDFILSEVPTGRTNLNYFLDFYGKKYFLRTNILKVPEDAMFWWKLEKEYQILMILGNLSISAKPYHFYKDDSIQFLLLERLDGFVPKSFEQDQRIIIQALSEFQKNDIISFPFIQKNTLKIDFEKKIRDRIEQVTDKELRWILERLIGILPSLYEEIQEEYCLCHNDFRADNILISQGKNHAWIIDVEGLIIADRYIDIAEYYVGGIFWSTFLDKDAFNFDEYTDFLDRYGYGDKKKQLYMYILQYCSYFSWISMHVSTVAKPLETYTQTLEINRKK